MSKEAMQMALDMLNEIADEVYCDQRVEEVITAMRQALEAKRELVGLTDEEATEIEERSFDTRWAIIQTEAKLREKNKW